MLIVRELYHKEKRKYTCKEMIYKVLKDNYDPKTKDIMLSQLSSIKNVHKIPIKALR